MNEADRARATSGGVVVTEDEIERLTAEASRGGVRTGPLAAQGGRAPMGSGPAEVVPVWLDPELRQALEARAETEATTASEVIRRALRDYLDVA